jgi:glyoxylase-like metal-dependent hydrolase (beta-lactamase superfamily II)
MDQLRTWLDEGRTLTVLDIRPSSQREEWRIPGSLHLGPDGSVRAGEGAAEAPAELPRDRPVVAVCAQGRTSIAATDQLVSRGFEAYSLEGGMKGWSLAWNAADVPGPAGGARVIQFRRTGKGCLSYLLVSNGQAMAIDPSLDVPVYLEALEREGAKLVAACDTHVHADHLSRARALAKATGATYFLPQTDRVTFDFHAVADGDAGTFGASRLEALRTPGHTFESTSYLLDGWALFTGDTLFLNAVGRPDLKSADPSEVRERARLLWRSIQRLFTLPAETLVLPCHVGDPIEFDRTPRVATLGDVRARVTLASAAEDAFVEEVVARIPATPPNHREIVRLNERGELPEVDLTDLEAGANRCAISQPVA